MARKVLLLGGYGNFGRLISRGLVQRRDIELIIAGRSGERAGRWVKTLEQSGAPCRITPLALDINDTRFARSLCELQPFLVIHTSGPYQGQGYQVPAACIDAGSHYLDLADDRRFVCDFHALNRHAQERGCIAVTGASSVPGLSSVVIDTFSREFQALETIEFFILPGSRVDLGAATLSGILSYLGEPFGGFSAGGAVELRGWLDVRREYFGSALGTRWLANVNIPDLELFPRRYAGVRMVRFQAGHELGIIHLAMALMAWLSKRGMVTGWNRHTALLHRLGRILRRLGSDVGGMVIRLSGTAAGGEPRRLVWRCIAPGGAGPHIPTFAARILALRILNGEYTTAGARPCLGLFELEAFRELARPLGVYEELEVKDG